jgi:hypothetical protein
MEHLWSKYGTSRYLDTAVYFLPVIKHAIDSLLSRSLLPFFELSKCGYSGQNRKLDLPCYIHIAISLQHQAQQLILEIIEHVS